MFSQEMLPAGGPAWGPEGAPPPSSDPRPPDSPSHRWPWRFCPGAARSQGISAHQRLRGLLSSFLKVSEVFSMLLPVSHVRVFALCIKMSEALKGTVL